MAPKPIPGHFFFEPWSVFFPQCFAFEQWRISTAWKLCRTTTSSCAGTDYPVLVLSSCHVSFIFFQLFLKSQCLSRRLLSITEIRQTLIRWLKRVNDKRRNQSRQCPHGRNEVALFLNGITNQEKLKKILLASKPRLPLTMGFLSTFRQG